MLHPLMYLLTHSIYAFFFLDKSRSQGGSDSKKDIIIHRDGNSQNIAAQTFTFRELAAATKNFRQDCLLGEGGFGRVYKGRSENGQVSLSLKPSCCIGILSVLISPLDLGFEWF